MPRRSRRSRVVLSVAGALSAASPAHAQSQPPMASSAPSATDLNALLDADAVFNARPARRTLYSWTTTEQLETLRRSPGRLLIRDRSPTAGLGMFGQLLGRRAEAGDVMARLFRHEGMLRARFAWANPWATAAGSDGVPYGSVLLRITLRPQAWIARWESATLSWSVIDLDNRPVAQADALAHPERIAAVYFVHIQSHTSPLAGAAAAASGSYRGHREYVIVNESMIEGWETDTPDVVAAIEAATRLLHGVLASPTFRAGLPPDGITPQGAERDVWPRARAQPTDAERYEAALAVVAPVYDPSPTRLATVINQLDAARTRIAAGSALQAHPTMAFRLGTYRPADPADLTTTPVAYPGTYI